MMTVKRFRNFSFGAMVAALAVAGGAVLWASECASSACTCGENSATWQWGSGTLDCETKEEYCEIACASCTGGEVSGVPECNAEARTIVCQCTPGPN